MAAPASVQPQAAAPALSAAGTFQAGAANMLGHVSSAASNTLGHVTDVASGAGRAVAGAGRAVAGQATAAADSVLKKLHFSEYGSAALAELFGSFLLTLTVSLAQTGEASEKKLMPLAVGFMYASLIFSFSYISGGHFNPAMTLGVYLARDGPKNLVWHKAVIYWVFQLLGSTLAAFYSLITHGADFAVPLTPDTFYPGIFRVLVTEAIFTFMLVSVMLHVAHSKQKDNSFHGFAVGMAFMAATLSNNGGVLNPATATSLIVVKCFTGTCVPLLHLWVFWVGELIGCIMAAIFYNVASSTLEAEEIENQLKRNAEDQAKTANRQQASLQFGDAPQEVPGSGPVLREHEGVGATPNNNNNRAPGGLPQPSPLPSAAPSTANPYRQVQQPAAAFTPNVELSQVKSAAPIPSPFSPSGGNAALISTAPPAQSVNSQQQQQQHLAPPPAGHSASLEEEVSPLYQE